MCKYVSNFDAQTLKKNIQTIKGSTKINNEIKYRQIIRCERNMRICAFMNSYTKRNKTSRIRRSAKFRWNMLRLWHRTFARRVKKEEKRVAEGETWTPMERNSLSASNQSNPPSLCPRTLFPPSSRSRRKTGGNSCAEIRKRRKRVSQGRMKGKVYPRRNGNEEVSEKGGKEPTIDGDLRCARTLVRDSRTRPISSPSSRGILAERTRHNIEKRFCAPEA